MMRVLGVDASRNRSGGARAHLVGLLSGADPRVWGIGEVHVWAHRQLAEAVPDRSWVSVHSPKVLEGPLPRQVWWQYSELPRLLRSHGCDLVFNTDAGSVCPFTPSVTLSQDLLSYEPGEMARFGWTAARLRLLALRYVQNRSFRRSDAVIFLTRYASELVQRTSGPLRAVTVIPHGIDAAFRRPGGPADAAPRPGGFRVLYVSEASMYKHQWNVVRALGVLRREGYAASLLLVGGGRGRAQRMLDREVRRVDPSGEFVSQIGFVAQEEVRRHLHASDLFVFASSCENLPITLLEAMAAGLPIACSDRGPMPEVLGEHGVYMNPEDPDSIADALRALFESRELRERVAAGARAATEKVTWEEMSRKTWEFLAQIAGRKD